MISKDLLEILACPQCKGALQLQDEKELLCEKCLLLYEIRDDIPIMLIDQAKKVEKST
ncbi:MAG: Trm112 family protein [Pseudomonadota bacterium]